MHNKHWEDLIPFYVAGSLVGQELNAFEAHIAHCDQCKYLVNDWRGIAAAVWQNAQEGTHELPPLSQEVRRDVRDTSVQRQAQVSAKLKNSTSDKIVQLSMQSVSSPSNQVFSSRSRRAFQIPVTLVAVSIAIFLVVGLLVIMSTAPQNGDDNSATSIAGLSSGATETQSATITQTNVPLASSTPSPSTQVTLSSAYIPSISPNSAQSSGTVISTPSGGVGGGQAESPLDQSFTNNGDIVSTPVFQNSACYALNSQEASVNIYEFAGIQHNLVGQLNPGDRVEVYVVSSNGWYQTLRISDQFTQRGWIDGDLVQLEGLCDSLPLPTPTRSTMITPSNQQCLISSANGDAISIYAGPGDSYDILTTMSLQATANAQAVSDNSWYRVSYTALSINWLGWVNGDDVALNFNCDDLPLITSQNYPPETTPVLTQEARTPTVATEVFASPEVVQFMTLDRDVSPGSQVTLRWETRNAENIWIEYHLPSQNMFAEDYEPLRVYSDLSPTGTISIRVPIDYDANSIAFSLIVDTYNNIGRTLGATVLVDVAQ